MQMNRGPRERSSFSISIILRSVSALAVNFLIFFGFGIFFSPFLLCLYREIVFKISGEAMEFYQDKELILLEVLVGN